MKSIQTSILTITLAAFAFAIMTPDAQAVPLNKVPGTAYKDGKFDKPAKFVCTEGNSCKKKQKSNQKNDRKPYWKKKTGN